MIARFRSLVVAAVAGVLLGGAGLLVTAGPAQAHAELLGTTPKAGATVTSPPVVVLQFDEPVLRLGLAVQVTGPSGRVDDGPVRLAGAGVLQPLKSDLVGGSYRVIWRVTSDDGHPVQGSFRFTAAGAAAGGGASSPSATARPTGTARAITVPVSPSASGAVSTAGPLPTVTALAAASSSGGGSSTTRWTIIGVAIVLLALLAGVIASRRPRNRGGHANS